MYFFYFFLFSLFLCIESSLFNSLIVNTHFKNVSQLKSEIIKTSFFKDYLKIINAEDIIFKPDITNLSEPIFPFTIDYKCRPNLSIIPRQIGKIKISEKWDVNDTEIINEISTHYITFILKIIPFDYYNKVSLIFEGKIIDKKFYVPSHVMNDIIIDIEKIFENLIINYSLIK